MRLGRLQEACPRFEALLSRATRALGEAHLQTITYATNAGECLLLERKPAAALAILEPAHRLAEQHLGAAHPQTATAAQRLAEARRTLGMRDANPGP
jgi:hypothetical protein